MSAPQKPVYLSTALGIVRVLDTAGLYVLCEVAKTGMRAVLHYDDDKPTDATRVDFYNDRAAATLEYLETRTPAAVLNMVRRARVGRNNIDALDFLIHDGRGVYEGAEVRQLRGFLKVALLTVGM